MPTGLVHFSAAGSDWRKHGHESSFMLTLKEGVAAEDEARPYRFCFIAFLWVALLAPAIGWAGVAESDKVIRFDISRQRADQALIAFAEQADVTFIFPVEKARKVTANEVQGEFTPKEAIEKLLVGTGLHPNFQTDGALSVSAENGVKEQGETVKKRNLFASFIAALAASAAADVKADQASETEAAPAKLGEIIVTARKRTERLQDVPISMAVITAEEIDHRGLVNPEDYLRGIAGVSQVDDPFGQAIIIRGIETVVESQNFGAGGAIATYFGETSTSGSAGLGGSSVGIKLVDIDRVEVIRGPQGTAFGSASMSGAVRTIPVAPKLDRLEGKFGAGTSATSGRGSENYNFQVFGNIPLIKGRLAVRATAYRYQDSGIYRSRAGSDPDFQAAIAPFGAQAFATDEEEVGEYYAAGARVATLFQASDHLRFTLSYLKQKTETDGWPIQNSGNFEQTLLRVAPENVRRGQNGGLSDTRIDIANAVVEYDLGWADFLATYSYVKGGATYAPSFTQFGLPWPVSLDTSSSSRGPVGEIRLATTFDGAWNFLAGIFAEKRDDEFLSPDYTWHGDPETNFFAPGERFLGAYLDRRDLEQKAAFGEVSWEFLPAFTLTGGFRVYDYDRTVQVDTSGPLFGGGGSQRADEKASGTNFRANLSYKPGDNTLLYAGWSQGFRLGQPQGGAPAALCDTDGDGLIDGTNITIESTERIGSDAVDSYELGVKFALMDRRLAIDAALFRMEWSDIPVLVTAQGQGADCMWTYVSNVGAALSEGIELQANLQITDAWRVDLGGSWINARLTEDVPAQGFSAGDRLPGSPMVNANLGLEYAFGIGQYKAFVRADSIYVGPFFGNVSRSPNTRSGDYLKFDATARVAIDDFSIDLYVRNLTNEDAFTNRGPRDGGDFFGYRLRPRTIGLQLNYEF